MATPIKEWSKLEVRAVVRFLFSKGTKPSEIHKKNSRNICPDLAPSDFHLFGPLRRHLGGISFETEDDLISELRNWFDNPDVQTWKYGRFVYDLSNQQRSVLANSLALFTDVLHLGSDLVSFVISLLAMWLANKPATRRMSFGYHRAGEGEIAL
ncbi:Zinc transporter [Plakobranchus ocellatus]|uniref:Zinc transporter n=1 Tax=Plakobranchus ocellatus TaxID=259542 RepID=A0AAV3ZFB4_9GAST|nr:Zinc transporter [Plakobranchus ocellatus]